VNGITAEELMDCWEAPGSAYDAEMLSRLWASVAPEMRLARLSAEVVPGRYRGGFAGDGKSYPLVNLGALPGPMRQEMTWCMFWIIELGGRVQMPGTVMLARRLTEITADHRAGILRSLMDLPVRTWLQQIPLAVHQRRGKLPAPSSVTQMRQVLLRFLWLLDLTYDARPWWQRESWHPVEDPRIPLREHEPLGRQAIHFYRITAPWLRRGAVMARQGCAGNRAAALVDAQSAGIRAECPGCVPGRVRRHRAVAGRRSGPGAPADAGLPRPRASQPGHPRPHQGTANIAGARQDGARPRRAVLPVHARPQGTRPR
jgi:hypothetical protein